MSTADVCKAALVGLIQDGLPLRLAHFEALVVLRSYLAASPSEKAASNAIKLREYMKALGSGEYQAGLILDEKDGGLSRIPRPGCMEGKLSEYPTEEEIIQAWDECCSGQ